jgi:hypothetical protein
MELAAEFNPQPFFGFLKAEFAVVTRHDPNRNAGSDDTETHGWGLARGVSTGSAAAY